MSKIIIGIHGLGNKPPADVLKKWWKAAIEEGLEFIGQPHPLMDFEMVFWADLLYPELEDPQQTDPEHPQFIIEPYYRADKHSTYLPDYTQIKKRKFLSDQLDKIFLNTAGKVKFSSFSAYIIRHYFRDLDLYFSSEKIKNSEKTIRDAIRERLISILEKHNNKDILLIAHSMGSIIALDVLNNFDVKVDTLVTIGSPLGLAVIRSKVVPPVEENSASPIPHTIKRSWFNLADLKDKVALDFDLADDFYDETKHLQVQDFQIYNDYEHNGERNPHKAYGYLRTRKMAEIIHNFLMQDTFRYFQNLVVYFNRMVYRVKNRKRTQRAD